MKFTKAIVRPPAPNFAEGLTTADLGAPDYERALAQHAAYCAALVRCGLEMISLEPDPAYPDSTFVEDTAVISARSAILTRPGAPSRLGEIMTMRKRLADLFPSLLAIEAPGTLDGGDVCQAGDHFFIGISDRTNEAGAQQLASLLGGAGYTSTLVDIRSNEIAESVPAADRVPQAGSPLGAVDATASILHLKSGIAYLNNNRLVIGDALASLADFDNYDVVRVDSEEMYAANCVMVNNHVLVAAGFPVIEEKLRALGYQTIALEMSEFEKMDGGLSCLSLRF
jgi:dimethylargininase